jgi:hypothetical protein
VENVDLVRAVLEAYRNPGAMAMVASGEIDLGWVDPKVVWDASRLTEMIPDLAGVYEGHGGVRTYWRRWFEAWRDLDGAAAVCPGVHRSGWQAGALAHVPGSDSALEAAGLSE